MKSKDERYPDYPLFEKDEHDTDRYDGSQHDKPGNETEQAVGGDKADNGSARRRRCTRL